LDTPYFLTGSILVRKCPEVETILARLGTYRDVDFDITITEVEDGELELTIDGCSDLDDREMQRLEEQLQALGPYAGAGAIFHRIHDLDACNLIVAPSREAGRVALSRVILEDCRLMIGSLVPADRARLIEELRASLN
jgi:hypothetical protein